MTSPDSLTLRTPFRFAGVILFAAITLAVVGRIWWVSPQDLEPGPLLRSATMQQGDYRLIPRANTPTKSLVRIAFLEGYSPERDREFQDALKTRPSRYVREDPKHHYVEYLGQFGRIQVHSAHDAEEGMQQWIAFLPANLRVDEFFVPEVAILLDSTSPKYQVAIPNDVEHTYLLAHVKEGRMWKVVWSTWYGRS